MNRKQYNNFLKNAERIGSKAVTHDPWNDAEFQKFLADNVSAAKFSLSYVTYAYNYYYLGFAKNAK